MNKKKIWLFILVIIGLLLTVELAHIYYVANYEKYALGSFCSINDFIDCDGAARSVLSQFLGIPLAYWGMFFYSTIFFLLIVDKLKKCKFLKFLEVFKNPFSYIAFLGTIAFFISMIIASLSLFKINKLCLLCLVTYFVDLFIALVACSFNLKQLIEDFKTTYNDFISGVKIYPKTFAVLVIMAVTFLTYSGVTYNFVPHVKRHNSIMKYRKIKHNKYTVKGNTLGAEKPAVTVELYSDFVCPLCYINNLMIHQAVHEFSNIKVVHHNFPFDKECNKVIEINMHPKACFMARGAIAARKQGNYWEMSSLLYENQPTNMEKMLKIADKLGFDKEQFIKDMNSDETNAEIQKELDNAYNKNLDSTPTMYINGEEIVGVIPYYELKEKLVKHGAK